MLGGEEGSSKGLIIGIIVAVVVIAILISIGGAIWYFVAKDDAVQPPAQPPQEDKTPEGCGCENSFAKTLLGTEITGNNYIYTNDPVPLEQCKAICQDMNCDWISWAEDDKCVIKKADAGNGYSYIRTTDCPLELKNDSAKNAANTVIRTDTGITSYDSCKKLCDAEATCELAYWDGSSDCTLKAGKDSDTYTAYVNIGQMCL